MRKPKIKPKRYKRPDSNPFNSLAIWQSPASVRTVANIQNLAFNQVQNHVYGLINKGLLKLFCRGYCFTSDRAGINIYVAEREND